MLFAATWMDLEIIILSKSDKERQIPYDITYIWNLKYNTNDLFTKQKQTHRHRKQTYGGLPWWSIGKESALQCRGRGFDPC